MAGGAPTPMQKFPTSREFAARWEACDCGEGGSPPAPQRAPGRTMHPSTGALVADRARGRMLRWPAKSPAPAAALLAVLAHPRVVGAAVGAKSRTLVGVAVFALVLASARGAAAA
eukprot:CAMPEP_0170368244 /NCGR_PEP_ID=MMETSP0117_2-20130122/7351_1 /TAXON_ID=400756 /ORGANISM="Durinskia baltica, Strain CSIRO CS-38" /LENGTH=114 /DNA_ID=CAMNT_0010622893 /DNA_START=94 /DNA_END=436 /DNA_ORIENTATION=+